MCHALCQAPSTHFLEAPQIEPIKVEKPNEMRNHLITQVPSANRLESFYEQIWWLSFGK